MTESLILAAMDRALDLARRGFGSVEPNPQVGAVVLDVAGQVCGEGWHQRFGGPHAEVEALRAAGPSAAGGTLVVTLEPCSHFGKTPPCVAAVLAAGVARVVVGTADPNPVVAGRGISQLRAAGLFVEVGVRAAECQRLIAPFTKLMVRRQPWVIAKWAMSLDGKIATHTGDSQWISSPESRAQVHQLRGGVDAIVVGMGTALADDPLLTARPPGPRQATRVILDPHAHLPPKSQLAQTAREIPTVCVVDRPDPARSAALEELGVIMQSSAWKTSHAPDWPQVLQQWGTRGWTNILLEGGSGLLGDAFDQQMIDEVLVFVAPKLIGGAGALSPLRGVGVETVGAGPRLNRLKVSPSGADQRWTADLEWPK